jgi:murein L,D-transpeptidase YcbB/YkuD
MQILPLKSWHARVSWALLALAAATALSAAAAQERAPTGDGTRPPSITLPPLPDVTVKLDSDDSGITATIPTSPPPQAPAATDAASPAGAAPVAEPAAALPELDAALKDALDALVGADVPHGAAGVALRKEREAIAAFYAERNDAPLWIADGDWTAAAKSALARLEQADDDGLDIKPSTLPTLGKGEATVLAATELALSEAVVTYGRQASGGRIDPRTISALITEKPTPAEPARILGTVASAADAGAALEDFNPPQAGYKALRQKLAELRRGHRPVAAPRIPGGPVLEVGMKDPRVPLIRARFGLDTEPATAPSDLVYDTTVAAAVADFQRSSGLAVSGALTPRTIAALSGGQMSRLESEILVNMERWRWLPRDIGSDRIDVDIPDFTLALVHDDAVVHRARVIVGKPDTPTPVFSNAMQYIELNPYWNVPQSIIQKEMLPHLAQDPDYLRRMGYEVTTQHGRLIVRQPPGERNALGRIKFMFPNEHAVYLHDTPQKSLFGASRRAFSHGCVRVDQPLQLAELVLGKDSGWTAARIEKLIGGPNRAIRLPKALPIHIEYFTAWVDENGKLQLRDDIYGYSAKMKLALGLRD